MVIGLQIGKLQRGGGAESTPLHLDSKKPGLFRVKAEAVINYVVLIKDNAPINCFQDGGEGQ